MRPATSLALIGGGAILVWSGITGQDVFATVSKVVTNQLGGQPSPGANNQSSLRAAESRGAQ